MTKPDEKPWLSVIMPVYNGEKYLRLALESIESEWNEHSGQISMEIIALDDGSSDSSLEILNEFGQRMPLHVICQERGGSWVRSTNRGLSMARGEYFCFLHQDDLWLPGRLKLLLQLSQTYPQAGMLFHAVKYLDDRGRFLGQFRAPLQHGLNAPQLFVARLLVQNFIAIPAPMVKRSLLDSIGPMNPELWYTADWDYWLSIAQSSPVVYDRRAVAGFRIHNESQTVQRSVAQDRFREQLTTVFERHYSRVVANSDFTLKDRGLDQVKKRAEFSMEVNIALAGMYHRGRFPWLALMKKALMLGPLGFYKFIQESRIIDRVWARLKLPRH
ncbi:glycosyltransferase [Planctopirus ephydatiae]|nr:glycosyltransferase [Planctopirus ephydatiae]